MGGDAFIQAYEDAIAKAARGEDAIRPVTAERGTIGYVIEHYLASAKFPDLAHSTRKTKRGRLDRIRDNLGGQRLADIKARHIEAIMGKFGGPHAANRFKKEMSELCNYAMNKLEWDVNNAATAADARGTNSRGHLTWTEKDIELFRSHYPSGTKPRLAFELLLNTGAARVDAVRLGPRDIVDGTLKYNRAKTARRGGDAIDVPIPVLPALQAEIDAQPRPALTFLHHGDSE